LTSDEGQKLLDEIRQRRTVSPRDILRWRRQAPPAAVTAALRIGECRRKARAKFSKAEQMWLDPVGLEQATSEVVARHKAARFPRQVIVDLCSGLGGDALALAEQGEVIAVELDWARCQRLRWNSRVYGVEDRLLPCRGRAERFEFSRRAWIHIDPDRRTVGAGRSLHIEGYCPGPEFLNALTRKAPGGAIKTGPASNFNRWFSEPRFETEVISFHGECKEATIWFGDAVSCRRRATKLPEGVSWTNLEGASGTLAATAAEVKSWIYDPDPSLIRAGLLDSFATSHDLQRLAPDIDYLTSHQLVANPFVAAFAVHSVHPLDCRRLRHICKGLDVGPIDIRVRGLSHRPEELRDRLKPRGSRSATLILAGGSGPPRAILCYSPSDAGSPSLVSGAP
jgi:hypothetical protein